LLLQIIIFVDFILKWKIALSHRRESAVGLDEENVPQGKGARWIVIGAGGKNGWIPNTFKMWKGNVKSEDYHTEMNGDVFRSWFWDNLLPNVPPNTDIVIDRAPYHLELRPFNRCASASMRKAGLEASEDVPRA
jgi:hypothetical protein